MFDDPETARSGVLEVIHSQEREILLTNNESQLSKALYTSSDVSKAVMLFESRAKSNKLYTKASVMRGGNFWKGALNHVKNMALKVLPKLRDAATNFYQNNRDQIHGAINNAVSSGIDRGYRTLSEALQSR